MSGDELQVVPEDLTGKANQIRGLSFSSMSAQPALITPDALVATGVAMTNLSVNAESLWAYQEFGRQEGLRLAQTLDNVAGAYAEVDMVSGDDIGSTMGVPGSGAPGSVYPKGVDLPAPPHPPDMPIPKGSLPSDQMLFPPEAQRALEAGDDGASLKLAAEMWRTNARSLEASAQQFEVNTLVWEGEAADAAYAKFNAYRDWLVSLAGSWDRLAGEADRIVTAHSTAKQDNEPIAAEFDRLQQEVAQNPKNPDNVKKVLHMGELAKQSEEVRNTYARDGWPYQVQPADPPPPVVSGIPVTVDDHRRARKRLPEDGGQLGSGGGQQHRFLAKTGEYFDQGTDESGFAGTGVAPEQETIAVVLPLVGIIAGNKIADLIEEGQLPGRGFEGETFRQQTGGRLGFVHGSKIRKKTRIRKALPPAFTPDRALGQLRRFWRGVPDFYQIVVH